MVAAIVPLLLYDRRPPSLLAQEPNPVTDPSKLQISMSEIQILCHNLIYAEKINVKSATPAFYAGILYKSHKFDKVVHLKKVKKFPSH